MRAPCDHPPSRAACNHICFPGLSLILWWCMMVSHLHHNAEIFDIIFLRLNQLIENKPEQEEG